MQHFMDELKEWVKEHSKLFWIGSGAGAFPTAIYLLSDPRVLTGEFVVRIMGVAAAGIVGGLCTAAGKDIWVYYKKQLKRKRDAKRKKEIEEGKRKERAA